MCPRILDASLKYCTASRGTDEGLGGRPGSLWMVNQIGLMAATAGHALPEGPFYDLRAKEFFVGTSADAANEFIVSFSPGSESKQNTPDKIQQILKRKTVNPADQEEIQTHDGIGSVAWNEAETKVESTL